MKKLVLTGLALAGLTATTFAQGYFILNNSSAAGGIALNTAGNYQSLTAGIEVWEANTTAGAVPANLASLLTTPSAANAASAYGLLTGDGFKQEAVYTSQSISSGSFVAPTGPNAYINMADVSPAGSTVAVAMFAWQGTAATWTLGQTGGNNVGFTAWTQQTANYQALPLPPAPTDMQSSDLVLTAVTIVPEPSMFALAGLGAAAMLIFRRRK